MLAAQITYRDFRSHDVCQDSVRILISRLLLCFLLKAILFARLPLMSFTACGPCVQQWAQPVSHFSIYELFDI